jgi:hypothetical protein
MFSMWIKKTGKNLNYYVYPKTIETDIISDKIIQVSIALIYSLLYFRHDSLDFLVVRDEKTYSMFMSYETF